MYCFGSYEKRMFVFKIESVRYFLNIWFSRFQTVNFSLFLILQSLILSTAVPTIIGFSLWREVRFSVLCSLYYIIIGRCLDAYKQAYLFFFAVLPPCLSRTVWSAGVLRPWYGRTDQLDQVDCRINLSSIVAA